MSITKLTGQETLKPIGFDVEYLKPGNKVVYKNVLFTVTEEPDYFFEQGKRKVGAVKLQDAEYGDMTPVISVHPTELFRIENN